MIRGAVCRGDFGDAQRGHEQRGRHYAVVISPGSMPWSAVTVVPTSTKAPRLRSSAQSRKSWKQRHGSWSTSGRSTSSMCTAVNTPWHDTSVGDGCRCLQMGRRPGPSSGGAAGNRTRVLRHSLKASPCAVRYVSARISWSRELARMTIPVAVGVPMSPATELLG